MRGGVRYYCCTRRATMRRQDRELSYILLCLVVVGVFLFIFAALSVDNQWKTTRTVRAVQNSVLLNYGDMLYRQKNQPEKENPLLAVSNLILPELLNLSKLIFNHIWIGALIIGTWESLFDSTSFYLLGFTCDTIKRAERGCNAFTAVVVREG